MNGIENEIVERLDILIALMIPPFNESRYPMKGLAVEVLRYCDSHHTVDHIVTALKEKKNAVEKALTKLRGLGLIRSVTKGGRVYYVRLV